jgi:hypothetical protein
MRHRWQYENTTRPPLKRSCLVCKGSSRRNGYQGAWITTIPGIPHELAGRTSCPGTPWCLMTYGDKSQAWVLAASGENNLIPLKIVTPQAMAHYGRAQMEASLAEQELPPLPEEAWTVPT